MASSFLKKKAEEQAKRIDKKYGPYAYGGSKWQEEEKEKNSGGSNAAGAGSSSANNKTTGTTSDSSAGKTGTSKASNFLKKKAAEQTKRIDEKYGVGAYGGSRWQEHGGSGTSKDYSLDEIRRGLSDSYGVLEGSEREVSNFLEKYGATRDDIHDKMATKYGAKADDTGKYMFSDQASYDSYLKEADALSALYDTYNSNLDQYNDWYYRASKYKNDTLNSTDAELAALKVKLEEARAKENAARLAVTEATNDLRKKKNGADITALHNAAADAWDERVAIERQIEQIEYINKYKDKTYEDDFWGQFGANRVLGRMGQDTSKAYNAYLNSPTEENKKYAEAMDLLTEHFQIQNQAALDDENAKATWITKDLAQHLPQKLDQTKAGVVGGVAGGIVGSAVPVVGTGLGAKAGAISAVGVQSYNQMRGAAFRELLALGVDEETARAAANDEGVVSALIEMAETGLTLATLGTGKLLTLLGKGGVKAVAGEAAEGGVKKLLKYLGKYGVLDVIQETAEEGSQQAVSIANRERAQLGNTGKWDLAKGAISTAVDAFTGKNPEAREEIVDAGYQGGKLALMMGGATRVADYALDTGIRSHIGKKYGEKMGTETVQTAIETALENEEGSESRKIAEKLQAKQKAGKTVSNAEVGALVQAIQTENQQAPVEATESAQETLEDLARETVARKDNVQQARRMAGEIGNEQTPVPVNVLTDEHPARQQRAAETRRLEKKLGYGESGLRLFQEIAAESNVDTDELMVRFDTPYQAGLTGLPMAKADLTDNFQTEAYNAGRLDHIARMAKDTERKPSTVYSEEDSGFDFSDAPSDLTQEQKDFAVFFTKKLGVTGIFDGKNGKADYNAFYNKDTGVVAFAQDFGIDPRLMKKLGSMDYMEKVEKLSSKRGNSFVFYMAHEIADHVASDRAPAEMRAFNNAMYNYLQSGTGSENLARSKQAFYGDHNVDLTTEGAIEEVVADSIIMLYDGDEQKFMDAMKRVLNGEDQQAKAGAKIYKNKLDEIIQKLKAWVRKLTGKENAEARANLRKGITELEQLRDMFEQAIGTAAKAVETARENGEVAEIKAGLGDGATVQMSKKGEMLTAQSKDGSTIVFSYKTYQDGGRMKLREALLRNGHTRSEIDSTLALIDDAADYLTILAAGYAKSHNYTALHDHLIADITTNLKTGKQVMSALVNNGDYPVNIDLALICKKRVAYMNLMTRLIKDGIFDQVNYKGEAIADVNDILRANNFETACLGCFVESRRLQFQAWAETIVSEWNDEVDQRKKNAGAFGFASGKAKLTDADMDRLANELKNAGPKNKQGNLNLGKGSVKAKIGRLLDKVPSLQKHLTVADLLTPDGLAALRAYDSNIFSIVKSRYGAASPKIVQDFNPYASEIAMLTFKSVSDITSNAVKGAQEYIKQAKKDAGGIKKMKDESDSAFRKRKAEHNAQVENEAMRRYLYDIGGARIQSFSDFMIENVFDYLQIMADLAANKFPLHGYTKEIICMRLLGMTGAKWNGSLIAHTDRSMGKEYAGLLPASEAKNGNAILVHTEEGDFAIGFDDYQRNKATDGKSFVQSIGMKDIVALQLDPRYAKNVGSITIGVSDKQILAMLDSPLFSMVIPYHASGMLPGFAQRVGVDMYNDYTDYQNTKVRQLYDVNGNIVESLVDAKGKAIKVDTSYAFNAEVQKTGDARQAANNYIKWCSERHPVYDGKTLVGYATFSPKFSDSPYGTDFSRHPNYYKLLEDFNTYDCITGESAVQGAVTMTFPSESNRLSAAQMEAYKQRLRDTGIFSEKEIAKYEAIANKTFKDLIADEVKGRAEYKVTQDAKWEKTVSEIKDKLMTDYKRDTDNQQFSMKVTDKKTLDFLNEQISRGEYDPVSNPNGGYYVTYKSMSFWGFDEDGNAILRSPMAEYVDGKLSDAYLVPKDSSKLNWYQATETIDKNTGFPTGLLVMTKVPQKKNPNKLTKKFLPAAENQHLIADDWSNLYYNLRKKVLKNGKWDWSDVPARYNPYEHSSNLMLNDQFETAYLRDNLVTVKMYVPVSEDRGTYRAQWSKDPTGWGDWKTGVVAGNIGKQKDLQRRVYLSRYSAPIEIVSNAEVAQAYKNYLEGTTVAVPDNVVSPDLLNELKKAGVPIKESGKLQYSLKIDTEGMSEEGKKVISDLKHAAMYSKYTREGRYVSFTSTRMNQEIRKSVYSGDVDAAASHIAWVDPLDFIYATTTSQEMRENLTGEAGKLDLERLREEDQPIYLHVNMETGEIVGHEGRHRMLALRDAGAEKVAVIIYWSGTNNRDMQPITYKKLTGQTFGGPTRGASFTLHNALPLSKRYADAAKQLFSQVDGSVQFSLKDQDYMKAVNAGDMETAQRMVDEAAKAAGYVVSGYHGTTNLFTVFDTSKSNIENDWGRGIYATTSEEDADANYASADGADLTHRIERLAEMMEYWDEYEDMDYEQRVEAARNQLSQGENRMLHVAMRMENPVIVERGTGGTFFTYESEYDEEMDEYSEPSGTLIDVIERMKGIIEAEYEWASYDADGLNDLYEQAMDFGGLSAVELQSAASDVLVSVEDEDGNAAYNEILRAALEQMGFDGIVDNTVAYKFGELSGRRFGGMRGVRKGTTHFIAFNSSQVKLTDPVTYDDAGNVIPLSKRFNRENDDIRYSMKDSTGADITREQAEYFKDSQIRDEEGNLRRVYHGTNTGDFTVFDWSHTQRADGGWFGRGFYFAFYKGEAGMYGKRVIDAYLNITNPFVFDEQLGYYDGNKTGNVTAGNLAFMINFAEKFPELAKGRTMTAVTGWDDQGYGTVKKVPWSELRGEVEKILNDPTFKVTEITDPYEGDYFTYYMKDGPGKYDYAYSHVRYKTKEEAEAYRFDAAVEMLSNVTYKHIETYMPHEHIMDIGSEFTEALKKRGYDGVLQTRRGDEIVAFYPEQIKAADNKTPTRDPDINHSLKGEQEMRREIDRIRSEGQKAGKSQKEIESEIMGVVGPEYGRLLKTYGAIKRGEKPFREIKVPKKSESKRKVSQTVRTILEARVTPQAALPRIQQLVTSGTFSYDVYTDKEAIENAEATIKSKSYGVALAEWISDVETGKVSKTSTALGWALYNAAATKGDLETAMTVLNHMVGHQRSAAQALQATRILKKLTPDAQLYGAVKSVQKMEEDINRGKKTNEEGAARAAGAVRKAKEDAASAVGKAYAGAKVKRQGNRVTIEGNQAGEPFVFEYAQKVGEALAKNLENRRNAKPKEKTFLQHIVSELNRFASEKLPKEKKGKALTATDLLRDYIQNQSFYAEAWREAQIELRDKYADDPILSEFINSGIGVDANTNPQNAIFMRALVKAAADSGEGKAVLAKQEALGFTGMADTIADNLIQQTGATDEMADTIRDAAHAYVYDAVSVSEADGTKIVNSAIKSAMKDIGLKLSEVVLNGTGESAQQAIVDKLIGKYGFSRAEATRTADIVAEHFEQMSRKFSEDRLKSMFKDRKNVQKTIPEKIEMLARLGAFDAGSPYNQKAAERIFKEGVTLTIDEDLARKFLLAATQEERDEILADIYRDIGRQIPATFVDKWNAWRYLAMLGNPRTHVRNVVGNLGFAPVVAVKDLTATGIESVVSFVSRGKLDRSKAMPGRKLLQAAWEDYANVADEISAGGKYNDNYVKNQHIEEGKRVFKFKPLEAARKGNSAAMEKEDMWFARPHYAFALAQYCKAHGVTVEQLRKGKALGNARAYAIKEAQKATYRDTNAFSQTISELGRYRGDNMVKKGVSMVMEGVLPFRKTPANILVRGVEYSPIGLLNGVKQALFDVRKGTKTGAEAIDSIAAGLTGSMLLGLGLYMAAEGLIRGAGGDDEEEKEYEELQGHQAYALELPNGTSVTLDWLAPEVLPLFIGVNLYETASKNKGVTSLSDILSAVSNVTEPMLEMSCLQSLNDIFDSVGYASSNDLPALTAALASAATSYLTQAFPTILGQAERSAQGERMTTYTEKNGFLTSDMQYTLGKISAKTPGWDFQQIPYVDAWGRTESTGSRAGNAANNFLNPAYMSQIETSAMEEELQRLHKVQGDDHNVLPSRAKKYFNVGGERKDLTGEEYVEYATEKGQLSYDILTDLTGRKEYGNLPDAEKAEAVELAFEYANAIAKTKVSDYEPDSWVAKALEAEEFSGMDETEYILYKVALGMADQNNNDNNSYDSSEKAATILSMSGLSDADIATIWDSKDVYAAYDAGLDLRSIVGRLGEGESVNVEKLIGAKDEAGISEDTYFYFRDMLKSVDEPTESGTMGSFTQDEAAAAIEAMPGLSREQRAWLWQSVNKNWKSKNNPWK